MGGILLPGSFRVEVAQSAGSKKLKVKDTPSSSAGSWRNV